MVLGFWGLLTASAFRAFFFIRSLFSIALFAFVWKFLEIRLAFLYVYAAINKNCISCARAETTLTHSIWHGRRLTTNNPWLPLWYHQIMQMNSGYIINICTVFSCSPHFIFFLFYFSILNHYILIGKTWVCWKKSIGGICIDWSRFVAKLCVIYVNHEINVHLYNLKEAHVGNRHCWWTHHGCMYFTFCSIASVV